MDASSSTQTLGSLTAATGSTIVVALVYDPPDDGGQIGFDGLTWNGIAMTCQNDVAFNLDVDLGYNTRALSIWTLENVTGATGSVVANLSTIFTYVGDLPLRWTFTEVTGAASASFDKIASASGDSSAANSGNTSTTSQANEMLLGFIGKAMAVNGTWNGSFSAGQSASAFSGSVEEGYRSVTSTGAYAASKTLSPGGSWCAQVLTFKEGVTAQTTNASALHVASHVAAVTLAIGAVVVAVSSCSVPSHVSDPTFSEGPEAITVGSAHAPSSVPPVDFTMGDLDPSRPTPLAATVDSTSGPVTLRSSTSALGDADYGTYAAAAVPFGSSSGSVSVDGHSVGTTGVSGSGEISGVQFYVACRGIHNSTGIAFNSPHMDVGARAKPMAPTTPAMGTVVSPPAWTVMTTGLVATVDGSTPWTWPDLFVALTSGPMKFTISYTNSAPTGDIGEIDVAEIWCEVWGPVGAPPDIINIKGHVGPLPVMHPIGNVEVKGGIGTIVVGRSQP